MSLAAQIVIALILLVAGFGGGVKYHAGVIAQRDLAEQQQAARERGAQPPVEIRCCTAAGCVSANAPAVLDALRRPREEAHNALSHLSQRFYNMSKEVIDQLREPKGCGHGDD